jgi:hypothetical protein
MALHPKKTKFMIFNANEQLLSSLDLKLYINNNNANENLPELKICLERVGLNSDEPAIKFLGVHLDQKFYFKYHVNKIVNKISRSLYVIQAAKNLLSHKALKNLYYALVHSHLIYGIQIWSAAPSNVISKLEKLQKKAIRIICGSNFNSHTEPLFKKCEILPLKLLIHFFKILFMYDYRNNLLPLSFENMWTTNAIRRQEANIYQNRILRDDQQYFVPFIRTEHYLKFPLADFPRLWNNFEFNFDITTQSRNLFKMLLKDHFLSKLVDIVRCTRMLCPVCHLQVAYL